MKMSRICPAIVATLTVFAVAGCADEDQGLVGRRSPTRDDNTSSTPTSDPTDTAGDEVDTPKHSGEQNRPTLGEQGAGANATGTGTTAIMNSYNRVAIDEALFPGPQQNGVPRLGKVTGAGAVNTQISHATIGSDLVYVVAATVSDKTPNQNSANNSYLRGAIAIGKVTATGVQQEKIVTLPKLNGDRAACRIQTEIFPNAAGGKGRIAVIMASEDNGVNNNPQPVLFLTDMEGNVVPIKNNNRGANNVNKPANLIVIGNQQGRNIPNANNQRGPHTINKVPGENAFVEGMQYNNQASELFKLTINDDDSVTMNWFRRVSNTAQHCRPSVALSEDGKTLMHASVEANEQPAEIGWRLSEINPANGQIIKSKIAVKSIRNPGNVNNINVAEPRISFIPGTDKIVASYKLSHLARNRNNNNNGHAETGAPVTAAAVFDRTLEMVGKEVRGVSVFGRHSTGFATVYGPNKEPALATISGSSTGTGGGFIQVTPIKTADWTFGLKDSAKVYPAAPYADVANVQARGMRNPNNQARGFVEGYAMVKNPGFVADPNSAANKTNFMPETEYFSIAAVSGYKNAESAKVGKRNSAQISFIPAVWRQGLSTAPGKPTDKPGETDGVPTETGPAPRTNQKPTDTSPDKTSDTDVTTGEETNPGDSTGGRRPGAQMAASDGCSTSGSSPVGSFGFIGLAVAGVLVALRRKREEA